MLYVIAAALAAMVTSRVVSSAKSTDTGWQYYHVPPFRSVKLKDGAVAKFNDLLLRRRLADGTWEYRRATQDELDDEYWDRQY
jgi:hypothetical protein